MQTPNGKQIDNYWNRYDPDKHYKELLFRDGKPMQASEMNELQSINNYELKQIFDQLFSNGDVLSGGQITVNAESGQVNAAEGKVYLDGYMWTVPAKTFNIPITGTYAIGVYIKESVISEVEDPELLNPATGSRAAGLAGAWRRKVEAYWGFSADGDTNEFFPVYTVDDGAVRAKETPPAYDAISQAIAQYDQDSTGTGTYICSGLVVRDLGDDSVGNQNYSVTAGRFRVSGIGLEFQQDQRILYAAAPAEKEIIRVNIETAASTGADTQHVEFAHTPCWLDADVEVHVPRRITVQVTHAMVTGGTDALKPGSVMKIIEVKQGSLTFTEGTDFTRQGDSLNWSLSGAEPSPGATYEVTYDYYATEEPQNLDYDGFDVVGASEGYSITYEYSYALPRIDRLCLNVSGVFQWVAGVASTSPKAPSVPSGLLAIATVAQNWRGSAGRAVSSNGVRSILFDDMLALQDRVSYLAEELARTRLENDITTREAGARVGLVVDPFDDNSLRDEGVEQNAAIVEGWLTLPIDSQAYNLDALKVPQALPYTLNVILQQTGRSNTMKVNPYQAFQPLPAEVKLTPAVDRWSEIKDSYAAPETKYFYQNRTINQTVQGTTSTVYKTQYVYLYRYGWRWWKYYYRYGWNYVLSQTTSTSTNSTTKTSVSTSTSTSSSTSVIASSTVAAEFLRQITVGFDIKGFGPGEALERLTFDGLNVKTGNLVADNTGHISGSFVIPANVPTGTKSLIAEGEGGSVGSASFTGEGTITYRTLKTTKTVTVTTTTTKTTTVNTVNTVTTTLCRYDPLAQTFMLEEDAQLVAVDLLFTTAGSKQVRVRIVETSNGFPTQTVLAEGSIEASKIKTTDFTRIYFDDYYKAVTLEAGVEYALVVMTDDPNTALSIATLGEYDKVNKRWITSQPYTVGTLLSSSNASTWTAHQSSDLTFRLIEAVTAVTTREIDLGTVRDLQNVTDLILRASTETPGATGVKFILTMPDKSEITLDEGQAVDLAGEVSGDVSAKAVLTSSNKLSPGLDPNVQLIAGKLVTEATYVMRSMNASGATNLSVIFDAMLPSGSSVKVELKKDEGEFEELLLDTTSPQGSGVYEYKYKTALSNVDVIKLKLTLRGDATARPMVTDLRMLATK
ncbi:MAG: DUF4815 domain-containing protein [Succinivibrio sp.]|nr:DUF4815 domain-containing protein [Succinivibrio sp.]